MPNRFANFLTRLQRYASRPWYIPVVATSATLDYFVLASPAQSLFITTVLLNPARRVYAAVCFSLGAALGALLLAAGIQLLDAPMAALLADQTAPSTFWLRMEAWIAAWGLWALLGLSLIPIPLRTMVVLAALAGLSFPAIGLMVGVGRLLALIVIGQLVYQAPGFLMRFAFVQRLGRRVGS